MVINWLGIVRNLGRRRALTSVEMLLPGGTLLALLLFLWQRKRPDIRWAGQRTILL